MKSLRFLQRAAVTLACVGLLVPDTRLLAAGPESNAANVPAPASAAPRTTVPAPQIADVALSGGGTLVGQVVDAQGRPLEGAAVSIQRDNQVVARTVTDRNGQYSVSQLSGGLYMVQAGQGQALYRFWAPNTAPPAARNVALVVASQQVVRGNAACPYCNGSGCNYCSGEDHVVECSDPGLRGLDVITLALLGTSIATLVMVIENHEDIDELEDALNRRPASP